MGYGDSGGASRFFFVAKAPQSEKNKGLDDQTNNHPTPKPVALMRWLIRLVTPPGGVLLDPFCGSGTTGVAARQEEVRFIGMDQDAGYCRLAQKRVEHSRRPKPAVRGEHAQQLALLEE